MYKIIITCEHGGNHIPKKFAPLFQDYIDILNTHRGWDIGALEIAKLFARTLGDYFFYSETSRLLVDLNRSLHHPHLFSFITEKLNAKEKNYILDHYFYLYRREVKKQIEDVIALDEGVFHISVHSFTPVLNDKVRNCDVGLLYDTHRLEKQFSRLWKTKMIELDPHLKVRFNYPYLGKADGFITYLRKNIPKPMYVCLELEINQKFFLTQKEKLPALKELLLESFSNLINDFADRYSIEWARR